MDELIKEAISFYDFKNPVCEFIRHNENMTYKITDGLNKFVLRIHLPKEGFDLSLFSKDRVRETVSLLLYMNKNSDMLLQKPVKNKIGEYVTVLSNHELITVLSWIEGETLNKETAELRAFDIAYMATKLHKAMKGFKGNLPQYDEEMVDNLICQIKDAVYLHHISDEQGNICISMLYLIRKTILKLKDSDDYGVIHADLGYGNLIDSEGILVPIDFSLAGYGAYAQECGMIASNYNNDKDLVKILEGVRQGNEIISKKDAEIFLAFSVLLFIGAQHNRNFQEEWFIDGMRRWTENIFSPLLENQD